MIKALLEVCNRDFLTSEQIMFAGLLKALQGKFLDKGVRILMGRLSNLSGGAVETVVKKPQCFRLQYISSLAELESNPGKKSFYKILKTVRQ